MNKQNAVIVSVVCAGLLMFPMVSFGVREVPQSETGMAVSSNAEQSGQASGLEQEEIKNVNQNSGETQNKETETEQASNQNGTSGLGAEVNNQNQANVSEGEENNGNSVGSVNQNQTQNKMQTKQGEVLGQSEEEKSQRSLERRSQVAAAIMEMERIGDSNQGMGEQVRVVAQSQNEGQDRVETTLQAIQGRSRFTKFLVGPDYKKIKEIESELETQQTRVQEMVKLSNQLENEGDAQIMMEQIALLQDVEDQIRQELENEQGGFSLFGWLFRWFAK